MKRTILMASTSRLAHAVASEGATMPAKGKVTGKAGLTTAGVKATATISISADRINAKAREFADLLDENAAFVEEMNAAIDAAETLAVTPRDIYFDFLETLGDERLAASPVPGTKIKVVLADKTEIYNNNPDEYKAPKEDGSTGDVSRFFWRDVADSTLRGKTIAEGIKAAKKLQETDKVAGTLDEERYKGQQKTYRNNVTSAASLYHQIKACESYPGATFDWVWDDKEAGKLARTVKCLTLENANDHKVWAPMTVRQFLTLDFVAAMESSKTAVGGTYARLMETRRQDGDENAGNEEDAVKNVEGLDGVAVRLLNYLNGDDNMVTLKKALGRPGDFADRLLLALTQIEDRLQEATIGHETRQRELKAMYKAGDDRLNRRKVA